MSDFLDADSLMAHVRMLADEIGPRPAGSAQEARARDYVRQTLADAGIDTEIEEIPFQTPDTWGYAVIFPALLSLLGNLGRSRLIGGALSLFAAHSFWQSTGTQRTLLSKLAPGNTSGTLIVRLPAADEMRQRVVLIGHLDTNKHRATFAPDMKRLLLLSSTMGLLAILVNGLAQLAQAVGIQQAKKYRWWSFLGTLAGLGLLLQDEREGFIDGANDNATAVACLLGLGVHLHDQPLEHTEVWLAFTGAEETGCLGTHALLDAHGDELADAYFLDFEMVGAEDTAYVTHHSGLSYLSGYTPDPYSARLAAETLRKNPELHVRPAPVTILEEVGALRSRGYRGLCVVGLGPDGWLENWHQYSDNAANIKPGGIERAARFALAYMQTLDQKA